MKDSVIVGEISPYSVNPDTFSIELYFTGCNHFCKDCHNKHLWNYMKEFETDINSVMFKLSKVLNKGFVKEIAILGGEPLLNDNRVRFIYELCKNIKKFYDVEIVLFTGYELDYVYNNYPFLFYVVDYIKTGKHDSDNRCKKRLHDNFILDTANQKLFSVKNNSITQIM